MKIKELANLPSKQYEHLIFDEPSEVVKKKYRAEGHNKLLNIISDVDVDLGKLIDENRLSDFIGDFYYDCLGRKMTYGQLKLALSKAIILNISNFINGIDKK